MKKFSMCRTVPLAVLAGFTVSGAHAALFGLTEQSAAQVGNAVSGGAAAEDASTVWWNPAGMLRLPGSNFTTSLHVIKAKADFNNQGSAFTGVPFPLTGGNGGDAGTVGELLNFYYTRPINPDLAFGVGLNTPFGLTTKYDSNWVGRYQAIESKLLTLNLNPSLAYRVNDKLSVGGGIDINYISAKLTTAVNNTLIGGGIPAPDGTADVKGTNWGAGYNIGLMYQADARTQVGLTYRSEIHHTLSGDVTYSGLGAAAGTVLRNTGIKAELTLPDTIALNAFRQVDDTWAIMGDISRIGWSKIQELRVRYDNPSLGQLADTVTQENWRDTWRVSVGANYRVNSSWLLRGGIAFDQTPVRDDQHRTPRLPDANRKWLSVGANYAITPQSTLDFAYAHLFVSSPSIDATSTEATAALRTRLLGSYDEAIDILSVQYNYRF